MMKSYMLLPVAVLLILPSGSLAADWRPITPAELAQKTPRIDPSADAEAIFWDVRVEDRLQGGDLSLAMIHYIRIKIFTDRGKEQFATVEIEQPGKNFISDVAGRTIKPDGTVIELKKDSIFDRNLAKSKRFKVRGKSFALPNVEAGDIIEYRYKEVRDDEIAQYMRLYFQRDIPIWNVTYHVKPLSLPWLPYGMRTVDFQCKHAPVVKEPDGYYAISADNMPAFKREPNMPPEDQLRAWILIYYEEDKKIDPEKYWKQLGHSDYAAFKGRMNADSNVKRTAEEVVSAGAKPEDKLALLDTYCRTKITNTSAVWSRLTPEQRKAIKENHSPGDTLKQKAGSGLDLNLLFAAMANAAGFEARIARVSDRGDTFFTPTLPIQYFLRSLDVAVKVNDTWTLYDPATPLLDRGMLRWQEEGVLALISDPKEGFFAKTQFSEPVRSVDRRRGTFKLSEDGTLEGVVEYEYSGHAGHAEKTFYEDKTPAQREEEWKQSLQQRLSTAEITGFEMKDADDAGKPIVITHKISVPGYATRTGKRILLQPAFFQRNQAPRFAESTRQWPVYFEYGWEEDDEVTIELPQGWEFDQPVLPANGKLGDFGNYSVEVKKTTDGRKLIYRRTFVWGRGNRLLLPPAAYSALKKAFDFVEEQDNYTLALKAAADAK